MTVEEYVGLRIRERREELGMSSAEFGSRLGELLGKPWPRQAVSAAELGKRSLGVTEMMAIASVLDTSPSRLLTPPYGVSEVTMPSGTTLPARIIIRNPGILEGYLRGILSDYEKAVASNNQTGQALNAMGDKLGTIERDARAAEDSSARPPIVAAIVTSPLGVLVGRRNDGKPPWTFVAGEQDAVQDESPQDTATREVKEETGLRIVPGDVIGERDHPKTGRHMIYIAARPAPRASLDVAVEDTEELAEVRWVDLAELDELTREFGGIFEPVREHLARELGEA